ncbi:MAG: hypothetical protein ACREGF_00785 [Candidatus Saccharimonadales bacterium]
MPTGSTGSSGAVSGSTLKQSSTPTANPAPANHKPDNVEKQWVEGAKKMLEKNKDDPYRQAKDLDLFKAEYIKTRYNKDIKVSED